MHLRSRAGSRPRDRLRFSTTGVERYFGSDPGGERLRSAMNALVAWVAATGAVALLESATHAFEVDASVPGAVAANHAARLVVLMIGSTVALVSSLVVAEVTPRARAVTSLVTALGLWAGLALAIAVHGNRAAALVLLVIVPSAGAWFRRYGARGFASSFGVHVGYVIGFLVAAELGVGRLGSVGAVIGAAAVATYAIGLVFLPSHALAPHRMARSYRVRANRLLDSTALLMGPTLSPRDERRLRRRIRRQVVRLNETAVVLDVLLARASTADATRRLQRSLFEHERAVIGLARQAQPDAQAALPAHERFSVEKLVASARDFDPLAPSPVFSPDVAPAGGEDLPRHVPLVGGWLPGAAVVNAAASSRPGSGRMDRLALAVSSRVAVQLAVALTLAVTFGELISPRHVLWAVIAVYVTFLGAASDREQLHKALFRVLGTLAGVIVGGGLAHLTSPHAAPTLIVIAGAAFFLNYFGRVNYALVVFAATLGVTQFYAQVGELSNSLLVTRVEVTAVGAACAIVVGLLVLPLRSANAATLAVAGYLRALAQVLDGLIGATGEPTSDTRVLDARFHTATATLRPLTRTLFGRTKARCARVLGVVDRSHELARTVVHDSQVAAREGSDLTQVAAVSRQAATVARALADDLESPAGSRVGRVGTAGDGAPSHSVPPPGAAGLRGEVECIAAALASLAQLRGLASPDPALQAVS